MTPLPRILLHLAWILIPVLLASSADASGMTPHQVAELRQIGQHVVSPDGSRVAYTLIVPRIPGRDADGPSWVELHIGPVDGPARPFVAGQVNVADPAWTPDGRAVLFLARREGDAARRVYRIPVDGGEARPLATLKTDIRSFSLSPDGRQIALLAFEEQDAERKKRIEQGFSQRVFEEDLQPVRLWLLDLTRSEAEPRMLELDGSVQAVDWSPAGDRLALRVAPRELVDEVLMQSRIRFVDPLSGSVTAEVDTPGKLGMLAWAPDGRYLAFVSAADPNDPREGRLMLVGRDQSQPRELVPDLDGHIWSIAWRDARTLLYVPLVGVTAALEQVDIASGQRRVLLGPEGPIWDTLSVSGDGRRAVLGGHTPAHPRELFFVDLRQRSSQARRISDSNPWLAEVRLAPQQVLRYSARDGLDIEGLLIRPLDEVPGQRYPLILVVHGGPEAHYSHGWLTAYTHPGQVWAARGYAVFYPNYRASTGRGVAFSKANHGRPAAEEFDDLVDGVDHLIDLGLVDRARVGITGGSYGGYATAWGATYYSERFAAAVSFVGISDKIGMIGTTDIPIELWQVHYLRWPWEDWALYTQASPIFHAARSRTPTLILHGDADPRVDRSQSLTLYRYLKLAGQAPVRLVLYPGEGHGNQRAASRWDYLLRLLQWMDHYLKGDGGAPPAFELDLKLEPWTGGSESG